MCRRPDSHCPGECCLWLWTCLPLVLCLLGSKWSPSGTHTHSPFCTSFGRFPQASCMKSSLVTRGQSTIPRRCTLYCWASKQAKPQPTFLTSTSLRRLTLLRCASSESCLMANVWCLTTGSRGASMRQVPDCLVCWQGEGHLLGLLDGLQQCGGLPGTPPSRHSSAPLWLEVTCAIISNLHHGLLPAPSFQPAL